ncbi:GNAT family N-acetyltransferase [Brevibacillus ginsengisoli]|uniref:GNAT family N-acetyltransferase n=1 Tax=Brevibacillus ginsengisoli TaxID=363854 RepID=UPI003CF9CAAA
MYLLEKTAYSALLPFLQDHLLTPTFAYSVVHQVIEGEIFVNQRKSPTSMVIRTQSGIYAVIGLPDEQMAQWLREHYEGHIQGLKKRFTLFSPSMEWNQLLEERFKETHQQVKRLSFSFDPERFLTQTERRSQSQDRGIPKGYRCYPIDEAEILQSQEFGMEYYQTYWGGITAFLKQGLGFCVVHDGQVVSECTSIFANPVQAEIDIVTHEQFQGLGLGSSVARVFIEACLERGITPRWDCTDSNIASRQMAERLGFVQPKEHTIFAIR